MSKVKAALGVVAVVAAMVVGIVAYRAVGGFFEPKAELTNTVVSRQLETMQDLTTAREKDYGFEEFSEGNIAHVNQKKFTMFYSYEIRAGVDLSKTKIAVDNDNHVISITLPKADLQSVSVDPDSLRFFDEQTSLFNDAEVSDTAAALQDAKKTAANKATKSDLLKEADKQAKKVVQNAYAQIAKTDGYKVEVQVADK
ncbi:DUF4230 domain-containing protein [Bifidobacterium pseudocatenulatum]|uniref:DUF4230 domain-containing protein n=1 Tax=Bifidobacterium pseudocatenulatum TaxID=28026 RepID=UPI001CF9FA9D|nr:DUF4230 domain-containing protein [Bifidobacterium pseudocatenulatum]MCB4904999.1 DUF4230 domain-containing protein [Bifidobacterium pseudocatenulatum]